AIAHHLLDRGGLVGAGFIRGQPVLEGPSLPKDSSTSLSLESDATSARMVRSTVLPITSLLSPASSASSQKVTRVPSPSGSSRYPPVGRTGPAIVWNSTFASSS